MPGGDSDLNSRDCPAKFAWRQAADATERPCEVALILETHGIGYIAHLHVRILQVLLRDLETEAVDQFLVSRAMFGKPPCE